MKLPNVLSNLLPKQEEKDVDPATSRKYSLVLLIFVVSTLLASVPPLAAFVINAVFGKAIVFSILGSSEWVTLTTFLVITYTAGNTYQKHLFLKAGYIPKSVDTFLDKTGLKPTDVPGEPGLDFPPQQTESSYPPPGPPIIPSPEEKKEIKVEINQEITVDTKGEAKPEDIVEAKEVMANNVIIPETIPAGPEVQFVKEGAKPKKSKK